MMQDCRSCKHEGNDEHDPCRNCWKDGVWSHWESRAAGSIEETIEYLSHFLKLENKECYADKLIEAVSTSVSALEKQIPVKPTIKRFYEADEITEEFHTSKFFLCGKCGAHIGFFLCDKCGAHIGVRTNQYCSDCGQKIDWSDES